MRRWGVEAGIVFVVGLLLVSNTGCLQKMNAPPSPLKAGLNPNELVDIDAEVDAQHQLDMKDLYLIAEKVRSERKPKVAVPKKNILVLSGGGAYGAFCTGILAGWTESGTRPEFDVVTGISTGAIMAPLAFLGSSRDAQLSTLYTNLRTRDVFRIKKTLRSLLSDALADNTPLRLKLEENITPDILREIAAEHAKGRRLYIGTTELESRRPVIWDMGEIATRGTLEDLILFRKIILASSAIPGFFSPVRIPIRVNGITYEERHIDGGVSNSLFFRPPFVSQDKRADKTAISLYDSNVYVLLAGKLYADAAIVNPRALSIAGSSVSTVIYAQSRGDLLKLYTACVLTGMNYKLSSIPAEFAAPTSSTDFDPVELSKMYQEGYRLARSGMAFRTTPPGLEKAEGAFYRSGADLVRVQCNQPQPIAPGPKEPLRFNVLERFGPGARNNPTSK